MNSNNVSQSFDRYQYHLAEISRHLFDLTSGYFTEITYDIESSAKQLLNDITCELYGYKKIQGGI